MQYPVHPVLVRHDRSAWHLHLDDSGSVADRYAAAAVIGLSMLVSQFGVSHLGICTIASCDRVFIDASTNRSRRYCTEHCANKAQCDRVPVSQQAAAAHRRFGFHAPRANTPV